MSNMCFCCGELDVVNPEDLCEGCEEIFEKFNKKIFVFSANIKGIHEVGSARAAVNRHGAIFYRASGLQGDSYAIPTKTEDLKALSFDEISFYIAVFCDFVKAHPDWLFLVTRVGCGIGYKNSDIKMLFKDIFICRNVIFDKKWGVSNPLFTEICDGNI